MNEYMMKVYSYFKGSTYFYVIAEDKQKAREAGLEYLVKNHVDNVDIKTLDVVKKMRRVK